MRTLRRRANLDVGRDGCRDSGGAFANADMKETAVCRVVIVGRMGTGGSNLDHLESEKGQSTVVGAGIK